MGRFLIVLALSGVAVTQVSFAAAEPGQATGTRFVAAANGTPGAAGDIPSLPAAPRGRSTVIGGAIHSVDPVRDQFILKVFGGHPMKILFDARTQVYRDGVKASLSDLGPNDHASVETVLDGTSVFALSIHMLSQSPEGECEGQILSYNPASGELTLSDALSHEPIKLHVPANVSVVGAGQNASATESLSSLVKGTLISINFQSSTEGKGVVDHIAVLAAPGAAFVFSGNVTFLDVHSKVIVLVDPQDNKTYKISFDPARFPESRDLHEGDHVRVTASFDGTRYVASAVTNK